MGDNHRIAYPDNPIMAAAWLGCVQYCLRQKDIVEEFEKSTGVRLANSPIEVLVDQATGNDQSIADAFVDWVNENVWGENPFYKIQEKAGE